MLVTKTEIVGGVAVYWLGDAGNEEQVGVCFRGGFFNIARQSLAESLALANDILADAVENMDLDEEMRT